MGERRYSLMPYGAKNPAKMVTKYVTISTDPPIIASLCRRNCPHTICACDCDFLRIGPCGTSRISGVFIGGVVIVDMNYLSYTESADLPLLREGRRASFQS